MAQEQKNIKEADDVLKEILGILKENNFDLAIKTELLPLPNSGGIYGIKNSFQLIKIENKND